MREHSLLTKKGREDEEAFLALLKKGIERKTTHV
jgi:hypothetical protein